jgi:hypothetical protein
MRAAFLGARVNVVMFRRKLRFALWAYSRVMAKKAKSPRKTERPREVAWVITRLTAT